MVASGFAGHDPEGDFLIREMGQYPNIDLSMVRRDGRTSFTAVMSNNQTKERTFFQHAGTNTHFCEDHIDWDKLDVGILPIGYIMFLPALHAADDEYGTKMAHLLHRAQKRGINESGDRFSKLVSPALEYVKYCVINEQETQQTTL